MCFTEMKENWRCKRPVAVEALVEVLRLQDRRAALLPFTAWTSAEAEVGGVLQQYLEAQAFLPEHTADALARRPAAAIAEILDADARLPEPQRRWNPTQPPTAAEVIAACRARQAAEKLHDRQREVGTLVSHNSYLRKQLAAGAPMVNRVCHASWKGACAILRGSLPFVFMMIAGSGAPPELRKGYRAQRDRNNKRLRHLTTAINALQASVQQPAWATPEFTEVQALSGNLPWVIDQRSAAAGNGHRALACVTYCMHENQLLLLLHMRACVCTGSRGAQGVNLTVTLFRAALAGRSGGR